MANNRRLITPMDMANLIMSAQGWRQQGFSTIQSTVNAAAEHGISEDWALVALGFINDSPSCAEDWCRVMLDKELTRAPAYACRHRDRWSLHYRLHTSTADQVRRDVRVARPVS
jgi:hypothetical protein